MSPRRPGQGPARRRQRGLSLVELMIAGALGLIVVGAALKLLVAEVDGSRRLLLEARLHQDLRSATDLIVRDLRRAGYWPGAVAALQTVARPNPYAAATPASGPATSSALYQYSRDATENNLVDPNERFGLRLQAGVLQALEGGAWQQLTDVGTLTITRLSITPEVRELPLGSLCETACAASDPSCPRLTMRRYVIEVAGRATRDAAVQREVREAVRLRNDAWPVGGCVAWDAP